MVTELRWKAAAVADLNAVVDYISIYNPSAALSLLDEVEAKVSQLADQPKRGRPGRVLDTRELVVRPNYIVVYSEGRREIVVLRVLHAAQMWP